MNEKGTIKPQEFEDFFHGEKPNSDNRSIDWSISTRADLLKAVREGRALKSWGYGANPNARYVNAVAASAEIAEEIIAGSPYRDDKMMSTTTWYGLADEADAAGTEDWSFSGIRVFTEGLGS